MYDTLHGRYVFSCPARGEELVAVSSFRQVTRLPGAAHPAVYTVLFDCSCGGEHIGLVSHDDLDWAPVAGVDGQFLNLMTARMDAVANDLLSLAAAKIKSGQWPWSFYCHLEDRPRPAFPSSFAVVAPGGEQYGIAVRCEACGAVSLNLVSQPHLDLPFYNDQRVQVIEHVFDDDAASVLEQFSAVLWSGRFDSELRELQ